MKIMPTIPEKSIDLILCDLPYGTTACSWDIPLPLEQLWSEYSRLIKDDGAIALTASQPFTSKLLMSNIKMFKYEWIWEKAVGSNFAATKYQPMKEHESVLIFAGKKHRYYPQSQPRKGAGKARLKNGYKSNGEGGGEVYGGVERNRAGKEYGEMRGPSSVQFFNNRDKRRGAHPTVKPVEMMEYFIKTYTMPGEFVLDNCMGSGTTGIACKNLGREFIGIEMEEKYFERATRDIEGMLI